MISLIIYIWFHLFLSRPFLPLSKPNLCQALFRNEASLNKHCCSAKKCGSIKTCTTLEPAEELHPTCYHNKLQNSMGITSCGDVWSIWNFQCVVFVLLVLHANGAIRSMKFLLNLINLNDEVSTRKFFSFGSPPRSASFILW